MSEKRRQLIAGNWKMNLDVAGAAKLARDVAQKVARFRNCDVTVLPPFPLIPAVAKVLEDTGVAFGAQDISAEAEGAFTGEVNARMLLSLGCTHVVVGHSERREYHIESDDLVARKTARAVDAGLVPIVCVGEKLAEREAGETFRRVDTQITVGLGGLGVERMARVVIAYEPVWAIGTGRTATPAQAEEVHEFIRKRISAIYGEALAGNIRILYGGSVKADNAATLLSQADVDGALVGGASLSADSFAVIVEGAR